MTDQERTLKQTSGALKRLADFPEFKDGLIGLLRIMDEAAVDTLRVSRLPKDTEEAMETLRHNDALRKNIREAVGEKKAKQLFT